MPFIEGGAEAHVSELILRLRERGYQTSRISIPFKWYPKDEILAHATAWRLIDLSESSHQPIDLVIATKFPSYFVRHPHKVTWLIHQYRAAYELCGTPYSDFDHVEGDVALREHLIALDTRMLSESRRLFTNAKNTANRLKKFNGVDAEALYHPPRLAARLRPGPYGDYLLVVGRLETVKRPDLAIRAFASIPGSLRLVIAGDGSQRNALLDLARQLGLTDRVEVIGGVDDAHLIDLYAGSLAVLYLPFDEDYGYVTLEAFLSRKPLVTVTDAGGPLEFVIDGENGFVVEPRPDALADVIRRLAADHRLAARLGEAGFERARLVTWDGVVERLLGESA